MENQKQIINDALKGNRTSLETIIKTVQGLIYNLSVRFYWNPMDAEDATQEILIKIITHLSTFKNESALETWCYRIASNYLLNSKRKQTEDLTFEIGEFHLNEGLNYPDYNEADKGILEEEVKIGCSTSMLTCLSRPLRLAYILAEIFEFNGNEGALILEIEPTTFRKRLSDARVLVRQFMSSNCGIYNPNNKCRCSKQINYDLKIKRVNPKSLLFADNGKAKKAITEIESIAKDIVIFRSHPSYKTPDNILTNIKNLIDSGKYSILSN